MRGFHDCRICSRNESEDFREGSLRLASAISAAAALREETGFFVKEDMERIFKEVKITKLK